jgi:penicillin amidase
MDVTLEEMLRLQLDARNTAATRFRQVVLEPHAAAVRAARPTLGPLLDRLLAWDGEERAAARGAVAWHLAYHHVLRRTFGAKLGAELLEHWMGVINLVDFALFRAFEDDASPWAPPKVRSTLLMEALEDTARDLQTRGLAPDAPWGAMHTLTLEHPAGKSRALARAFNRGPFPADGGPYCVVSGQYLHARPGPVVSGPSYRHVIDLADPQGGRMITFGGQSGHIGSAHYDDLTSLWREGRTLPMRLESPPGRATILHLAPR